MDNNKITKAPDKSVDTTKIKKISIENIAELLDKSLNEIYVFDKETLLFEYVNVGAQGNLGYTLEQLFEMTPLDIKPEFNPASFQKLIRPLIDHKKKVLIFETVHKRANGTRYPVEVHLQLFEQENRLKFLAFILDTTERKKLEEELKESEHRLSFNIKNMPVGMIEWTREFQVASWNPAAEKIFGYTKEEVIGKHANIILSKEVRPLVNQIWDRLLAGSLTQSTNENITKDGRRIICEWHNAPLSSHDGKVYGVVSMVMDVTERKKIEENLSLQAAALQASADAIVITDTKGIIQWINHAFTTLTGYEKKEAIGQNMSIIQSGKYDKVYYKKFWSKILSGETIRKEIVNRRKDGTLYDEDEMVTPVKDSDGKITHFISIKRDITKRKKAEEYQSRLAVMVETTSDFTSIADPQGNLLYLNKAGREMVGLDSKTDIQKLKMIDFYPGWAAKISLEKGLPTAIEKGIWKGETALKHRDGHEIPVSQVILVHRDKKGDIESLATTMRDITELKESEKKIYDSEERFRLSSKAINNIIWDWDLTKSTILWSEGITTLFGYKTDNLTTPFKWWIERIHPEDRKRTHENIMRVVEGNKDYWQDEYRFLTGNGTYAYIEDHGYVLRDQRGKAYRMIGAMDDLTEKKVEEEKIKTNEKRFSKLLENSQDVIIVSDPNGNISYISPGIKRVLGFTPEEYKGIVLKQVHPDDLAIVHDAVKKVMDPRTNEPVTSVFRVKDKKGEWRWIESVATYEDDEVISGIVSNCHDITKLKNNEESALAHAEELAKFNALMIGRELKMIELKKTIEELESKLKDVKNE